MVKTDPYLALTVVLVFLALMFALYRSWSRRELRYAGYQCGIAEVPAHTGEMLCGELDSLYVGTTQAIAWQERVAVGPLGFRSTAQLTGYSEGIQVSLGQSSLWIPIENLISVRRDSKCAGKVMPGDGLLVLRWKLHHEDGSFLEVDSGFRAEDPLDYAPWLNYRTILGNTPDSSTTPEEKN